MATTAGKIPNKGIIDRQPATKQRSEPSMTRTLSISLLLVLVSGLQFLLQQRERR